MDPLFWLSQLDPNTQNLFVGAAGNLLGNLATDATKWLLGACARPIQNQFRPDPAREALERAMAQALAATMAWLTDDPDQIKQLTTLFEIWLRREAVTDALYPLLDPSNDSTINLEALNAEFTAAGWSADDLGEAQSFGEIVAQLVEQFARFAEKEAIFQEPIKIGYLRQMANQLTTVIQSLQAVNTNLQPLQQFHPLDLNDVEQAYLNKLFTDCNALPLAQDEHADPGRQGPRLQQIYVELRLNRSPSLQQVAQRYASTKSIPLATAMEQLKIAIESTGAQSDRLQQGRERRSMQQSLVIAKKSGGKRGETTEQAQEDSILLDALLSFDEKTFSALCETLEIEEQELRAALHNMTPLEALEAHKQIILLGDPGGGKSTLTQRWAALLAAESSAKHFALLGQEERTDLNALLSGLTHWRLPMRIVLNRWAQHLSGTRPGTAADIVQECARVLGETSMQSDRLQEWILDRATPASDTLLLLLDGLDEVTDANTREQILAAIVDFHKTYEHVPMLITCRVRPFEAWRAQRAMPKTIDAFELAPLHQQAIEQFVQRWYSELQKAQIYLSDRAQQAAEDLIIALRDPRRKELREMAGTPLLLTMMARVNYRRGLPNSRAELYKEFVDQLLYEWDRLKQQEGHRLPSLDDLLNQHNVLPEELANKLDELAHELHSQQSGADTVDIPVQLIRGKLAEAHRGSYADQETWSREVLQLMVERSGLINVIDTRPHFEIYKFAHRTFQEYLAARYLASGLDDDMVKQFATYVDREEWREVWLLAIGILTDINKQTSRALYVLWETLPERESIPTTAHRTILIGEAFIEIIGQQRAHGFATKLAKPIEVQLITLLCATMQHPTLPPRQRLDAGLLLAELEEGPADVDELVTINAGPKLGIEFKIGKYPVTNTQFRRFFDDDGYSDERWWSEEGVKAKAQYGYREPRYWDDNQLNRSSQPVVGVSWYEAQAYCNWLTVQWRADNTIDQAEKVRLPTRAEWEAAAYSGKAAPDNEAHDYPWRGPFTPAHANTEESNLGQTTPVYMYPLGTAKVGKNEIWDLSGNVFEWTSDLVKDDNERAWVKGGAFYWNKNYAKASAAVSRYFRGNGNYVNGFRVVVVPISR